MEVDNKFGVSVILTVLLSVISCDDSLLVISGNTSSGDELARFVESAKVHNISISSSPQSSSAESIKMSFNTSIIPP